MRVSGVAFVLAVAAGTASAFFNANTTIPSPTLKNATLSLPPINPDASKIINKDLSHPIRPNAQRLARGFAPLRPARLYGSRVESAPRAGPSGSLLGACTTGNLAVYNGTKGLGTKLGYMAASLNAYGEYTRIMFSKTATNATMLNTCNYDPWSGETTFNIQALNPVTQSIVFMGGISGFNNSDAHLAYNSSNYFYIGQTGSTAHDSIPVTGASSFRLATNIAPLIESSVWVTNATSGRITFAWRNANHTLLPATLLYVMPDQILIATGNATKFATKYKRTVFPVAFGFEADPTLSPPSRK